MIVKNLAISSGVMSSGLTVADFFHECVHRDVRGLPFVNDEGKVVGRVSIRHLYKLRCIPSYMLGVAHLLGDEIDGVRMPQINISNLLQQPIDEFVLADFCQAKSHSPVIKVMALMEQNNTSYVFIIDEGEYQGIVTHMGIARRLLETGEMRL